MASRLPAPLLLALLSLGPLASPLALAQGNGTLPGDAPAPPPGPAPTPFEPLPAELRAVAFRWLDQGNATIAAFRAAHPGQDAAILEVFRDGAWDFLNESRLSLGMSQLLQLEVQALHQGFFPALAEEERRNASVRRAQAEEDASQAALQATMARLVALDQGLRSTHGLEYAVLAAGFVSLADNMVRDAPNSTRDVAEAPAAEERVVRFALLLSHAPQAYLRWAGDLLDLTERVDAEPGRPQLPPDARARLQDVVARRLDLDPGSSSITGPNSAEAFGLLEEAEGMNVSSWYVARFLAVQTARSIDALEQLRGRGSFSDAAFADNLRLVAENATLVPHYDGTVLRTGPPGLLATIRAVGYQGLLHADGLNHAHYRLQWDRDPNTGVVLYGGAAAAWGQLLQARYFAETVQEVPAVRAPAPQGDWLLFGGIAVAAALAVVAVVVLRRP